MSLVGGTVDRRAARVPSGAASPSLFASPRPMLLIGLVLGISVGWHALANVWNTQAFADTDDAMHLVQVRDWLNGQDWFDMVARRLGPGGGTLMHWTHVEDLPMAALIRLFGLFAPVDTAERLARIVYPLLLQAALYALMIRIAQKLVGDVGVGAAVILTACSITVFMQFAPGRITHHHVEIVLLMAMVAATLEAFDDARGRWPGLAAGCLAALSLSISIEDLPFIAVMIAALGLGWVVRGRPLRDALVWSGASLALGTALAFGLTVPASLYAHDFNDVLSRPQLVGAIAAGCGLIMLAALGEVLPNARFRLLAAIVLGGFVLTLIARLFPQCFGDPFARADPLVHRYWMENIQENQPFGRLLWKGDKSDLALAIPPALGLICLLAAVLTERGPARARWAVVLGFAAIGALGAFWQVRVLTSATPSLLLGGVWLFVALKDRLARSGSLLASLRVLVLVPFAATAWALVLPATPSSAGQDPALGDPDACFASKAFIALTALPETTILAPIDSGPYLLAFTPHRVIAGPYHRDMDGLHQAIQAFLADPRQARDLVRASGAAYVALCPAAIELDIYAGAAPHGLAARLRADDAPPWLRRVDVPGTPYRVYRVL